MSADAQTGIHVEEWTHPRRPNLITLPHVERVERVQGGMLDAGRWQLVAKRAIDVAGSLVLLLALLPLFVLTALAVKLTSRGPVLFVQERAGKEGRRFDCYKFRSMYVDAEERRTQLIDLNEANGPVFKVRNDPRVTPVGRVIRKLSIDELPQLVNVLRGDMSLVGPRPAIIAETEQYDAHQLQRLLVKPGLTCIWQVEGRSDIGFDEWIEMDLTYIRQWSLALDLQLLVRTIPAVLSTRGAY